MASRWTGMNVLCIDHETVLVDETQKKLIDQLRNERIAVIEVPLAHCQTFGGGLHRIVHRFGERMKVAFIGLGKLGMPCAEAIAKKGIDVTGFDTANKKSDLISIKTSIEDTVKDRDIIFIAVPTPHEAGYDGRLPTSDNLLKILITMQ
jgi:hypothetical protein